MSLGNQSNRKKVGWLEFGGYEGKGEDEVKEVG